jgi:di/tripeptidase
VQDFLKRFAEKRGLAAGQDAAGNMVIFRPGSGGGKYAPPVVIQGHIDMVSLWNTENTVRRLAHIKPAIQCKARTLASEPAMTRTIAKTHEC